MENVSQLDIYHDNQFLVLNYLRIGLQLSLWLRSPSHRRVYETIINPKTWRWPNQFPHSDVNSYQLKSWTCTALLTPGNKFWIKHTTWSCWSPGLWLITLCLSLKNTSWFLALTVSIISFFRGPECRMLVFPHLYIWD